MNGGIYKDRIVLSRDDISEIVRKSNFYESGDRDYIDEDDKTTCQRYSCTVELSKYEGFLKKEKYIDDLEVQIEYDLLEKCVRTEDYWSPAEYEYEVRNTSISFTVYNEETDTSYEYRDEDLEERLEEEFFT